MRSCAKTIVWSVDLAIGVVDVLPALIVDMRHTPLHGCGKISLFETTKRGLESPPGIRSGTAEHEMGRTRLNTLATKLAVVLSIDGGLHDFSEGVAAALEDVSPQHLVHPHLGDGSSVDGLLGVVVLDEVDRESVLVDRSHRDGWARRDRWVVSQHVWEFNYLDPAELDGLSLDLDVGDYIA